MAELTGKHNKTPQQNATMLAKALNTISYAVILRGEISGMGFIGNRVRANVCE